MISGNLLFMMNKFPQVNELQTKNRRSPTFEIRLTHYGLPLPINKIKPIKAMAILKIFR